MEILVAASIPRLPPFPQISKRNLKPARLQPLYCSRWSPFYATVDCRINASDKGKAIEWNIGESNRLSETPVSRELGGPSDVEVHQNHLKSIGTEKDERHNDIWKLFKEAQQNILYLNKQRLLAMEELDRVKNERNSLLDKVEQLEMKKEANIRRDKITISSELLLRIDSLVLNGVIGSTEACDLRRLVIDSRGSFTDDLYDIICKNDAEFLAELRHFSKKSKQNGFHIIHICTEMSPVVSVGSLASYITGLSRALQRKGNLVEVILPKYACLNLDEVQGLREIEAEFYSYFNGHLHGNRIWTGVVYGIGVTFIEPVYYSSFFSHDRVYGCPNDFESPVSTIGTYAKLRAERQYNDMQGFEGTRILLTCQGFDSQCLEQPEKLALCGLDPSTLLRPDRLQDNNKSHLVNILKGGVVYSNKVIIMSSGLTEGRIISASGHGLEPTLAIHKEKLVTAPCGFDKSTWDPSCDDFLPQSYSADDMKGKSICKVALQRHLGLHEAASKILVGCIYSDILDVDLEELKAVVWMASRRGVQFIFMGSSLIPGMRRFQRSEGRPRMYTSDTFSSQDENVRFVNEYDEELSHLIISGSDIMLCPSFDDPLLQVPLKAMKYGAAPVPVNYAGSKLRHFGDETFESTKFSQYFKYTFANMSLGQAIDEIENNPSQWNRRIKDAMEKDFSWDSECADVHISAYTAVRNL
ncbi:hypothetical protein DH2020_016026 [Rehmannia glutinosa]|uniref:starch synthase n=1 Tax=Rehmannia glutinosa TaxID=99300 RepID=A0ABR0WXU9_REHGL